MVGETQENNLSLKCHVHTCSMPTLFGVATTKLFLPTLVTSKWSSLAKLELKVSHVGRGRLLVAHASKCEHANTSGHSQWTALTNMDGFCVRY